MVRARRETLGSKDALGRLFTLYEDDGESQLGGSRTRIELAREADGARLGITRDSAAPARDPRAANGSPQVSDRSRVTPHSPDA